MTTEPLNKRTSMVEVAGGDNPPHLVIRFGTVEEMQAASDYVRMLSVPEHLRDPMKVLERGRHLEERSSKTDSLCGPAFSQVSADHAEAQNAALIAQELLKRVTPDVPAVVRDAYAVGYIDGLRAERARHAPETTSVQPLTLRDFGYAPGGYTCACFACGVRFTGDKRAIQCEPCARSKLERSQVKTSGEQDAFNAGVTQAKYRFHYKEALLKILNAEGLDVNAAHFRQIALTAINTSPEESAPDVKSSQSRAPEVCGCPYGNCTCDDGSAPPRT